MIKHSTFSRYCVVREGERGGGWGGRERERVSERERERYRERQRQTDGRTDRQTDGRTD